MATPQENLANSLGELKRLQDDGIVAIRTDQLSRVHRERLVKNGFLKEVYQGWYIASSPTERPGDSTSWYNSYWAFCRQLLDNKYGDQWILSPDQSLLLHAGKSSIPQQMIVRSPDAGNFATELPHNTSLYHMKASLPTEAERVEINGMRVYSLPQALIDASPSVYNGDGIDVRTALSLIRDPSDILRLLLAGGHSKIAGRLAGAFRNIDQDRIADEILKAMKAAGYTVSEKDPFDAKPAVVLSNRVHSPYENRIKLMWHQMRETVLEKFPPAPGLPKDIKSYMEGIEKIYVTDAYHSLSIEKYQVTPELIERVRTGAWNAKGNEADRKERNAMAAKGYYEAFKAVERSVERILKGANAGETVDQDHGEWYRELFSPSVAVGLLKASDLAGYRNHHVYIGGSMHTPLNKEAIRDAMPTLFDLLRDEPEASVRATLGHFIFVFIHPYMDGNGRMGRFLMNAMLASGGYPWTVIPVERRDEYMAALEQASVGQNIGPFASLLAFLVNRSLQGTPVATI